MQRSNSKSGIPGASFTCCVAPILVLLLLLFLDLMSHRVRQTPSVLLFFFEASNFSTHQGGNSVFRQAHLANPHAESLRHLLDGPMLDGMEIKHLIMPRVSLKFHARQRRSEYCALPFLLPHRVKIDGPRISNALDRGGTLGCCPLPRTKRLDLLLAFPELIADTPADDGQQPALKRADSRVIPKRLNLSNDGEDRFLHDLLRF